MKHFCPILYCLKPIILLHLMWEDEHHIRVISIQQRESCLLSPDGQHCLSFEILCGKVEWIEKDCLFFQVKIHKKRATAATDHKFLSRRPTAVLKCSLCGKPSCLFSMNGSVNTKGKQDIKKQFFLVVCLLVVAHQKKMCSYFPLLEIIWKIMFVINHPLVIKQQWSL